MSKIYTLLLIPRKSSNKSFAKKESKVKKIIQNNSNQKQNANKNIDGLKNFLPSSQVRNEWIKEWKKSIENPSAFVKSNNTVDKSHPDVLEISEQIKFNYFDIPHVLRKTFNAADTKIKITKKSDGNWEFSSIYCKNPYFRAYFYEEFKKLLIDPSILLSLKIANLNSFLFTINFIKISSHNNPTIEIKSQVNKNIVSISITELVQPEEYKIISGGLNIIGTALYAYDKAFPDAYQNSPLLIDLRKSKAFSQEGVIRD